jgi:hypothetical protein
VVMIGTLTGMSALFNLPNVITNAFLACRLPMVDL